MLQKPYTSSWLRRLSWRFPRLMDWEAVSRDWNSPDTIIEVSNDRRSEYSPYTRVVELFAHGNSDKYENFIDQYDYSLSYEQRYNAIFTVLPICRITSRRSLYSVKELGTAIGKRTRCQVCNKPLSYQNYPGDAPEGYYYHQHTIQYLNYVYEYANRLGKHDDCFAAVYMHNIHVSLRHMRERREEWQQIKEARKKIREIRSFLKKPMDPHE